MNSSILAYKSELCQDQWTVSEVSLYEGQRANRYIPARQELLQKITDIISELGE